MQIIMKKNRSNYIQNILLPCLLLSALTGAFTGGLIFLFKTSASWLISKSELVYEAVRENPGMIPVLILGMTLVGLISAVLLKYVPDARGGGIPTAITILRGIIPFHWIKSIVFVYISAMLTYFGGVPLGNEGPSIQMGTAVGKGTVSLFAGKHHAWDRYIMTGGACAGFAAATGSPITGMLFAIEEAHRRISPMIFMSAAMTALSGASVMKFLCGLAGTSYELFHFSIEPVLPMKFFWCAAAVGIIAGFTAAGFTKMYTSVRFFVKKTLVKVPFIVKICAIFAISAGVGVASADCIGSGHDLIDELMEGEHIALMLIVVFLVRALLLLLANNSDVTGGLFVPTLTFGAIVGALCGKLMVMANLLPEEYFPVMVAAGIVSYLGASSRTPLMALTFAIEALGAVTNIIPMAMAITISYLVIETLRIESFTDTVIESKEETFYHGQKAYIIEADMSVAADSFACGKEVHDLILPPTCVILSVQKNREHHLSGVLESGDILHVYFRTFDPTVTKEQLEDIFGSQNGEVFSKIHFGMDNQFVPG